MTSQTKHFIELSDIVSLRLQCRNPKCDTSLLLGLDKTEGNVSSLIALDNTVLMTCPGCGQAWMGSGHLVFDSEIKKFLRLMGDVKRLESNFGCAMTLEIKAEVKP
jgi:hypothetical protein